MDPRLRVKQEEVRRPDVARSRSEGASINERRLIKSTNCGCRTRSATTLATGKEARRYRTRELWVSWKPKRHSVVSEGRPEMFDRGVKDSVNRLPRSELI